MDLYWFKYKIAYVQLTMLIYASCARVTVFVERFSDGFFEDVD